MKRKTAVTKTDLVAVIGCTLFLLANLGAIGSTGRRRAKETVCLSNLHKWGVMWKMFLEDRGGRTPEHMGWWGPMWDYYKEEKLLLCPEAARPRMTPEPGYWGIIGGKFNAWAQWVDASDWEEGEPPPGKHYLGSYGLNYWFTRGTGNVRTEDRLWGFYPGSLFAVKGADRVPMLLDCLAGGNCPLPTDTPPAFDGDYYPAGGGNTEEIKNFCINRHGAAVNGLFLDFSARKVGLKELWLLRWHRKWMQDLEMAGWPTAWDDPNHWMHKMKDYDPFK